MNVTTSLIERRMLRSVSSQGLLWSNLTTYLTRIDVTVMADVCCLCTIILTIHTQQLHHLWLRTKITNDIIPLPSLKDVQLSSTVRHNVAVAVGVQSILQTVIDWKHKKLNMTCFQVSMNAWPDLSIEYLSIIVPCARNTESSTCARPSTSTDTLWTNMCTETIAIGTNDSCKKVVVRSWATVYCRDERLGRRPKYSLI